MRTLLYIIIYWFVVVSSIAIAAPVDLVNHEVGNGHTIKKHVGLSRFRLNAIMNRPTVSFGIVTRYKKTHGSFLSLKSANSLVSSTIETNIVNIIQWLKNEEVQRLAVGKHFVSKTGIIAYRKGFMGAKPTRVQFTHGTGVVAFLVKNEDFATGYQILTAYPVSSLVKR